MAINRGTLRIERDLQAFLATTLDVQTRAIVEAWVIAFDSVANELDAAALDLINAATSGRVTRTMVIRSRRAQAALEALRDALDQAVTATGTTITADLWNVIEQATRSEADMLATQLTGTRRADLATNLVRADAGQIAAMVTRATEQITSLTRPLAAETYATVRAELLRGISVGANPRTTARRMVTRVEDRTNFGLTRALVISRTETLDATRQAAQWTDQANRDVVKAWQWVASLSPRTCPACLAMHGREFPVDEPGPLGHQQCRCTRVPVTKTWAELGFTGIPDPPSLVPDADDYFTGLTTDQQQAILGPKRYEAWKAGEFPREQWATRRQNDGWRDSYVIAPAPRVAA